MYALGGVMGVAAVAHYLVRPLSTDQLKSFGHLPGPNPVKEKIVIDISVKNESSGDRLIKH
jgi:hypothetical protein